MYLESLSRRYRIDSVSSYKGISGLSTKGKENGEGRGAERPERWYGIEHHTRERF